MAEIETVRQLILEASQLVRRARSLAKNTNESGGVGEGERTVMRLLAEEGGMTVPALARASATTRQNVRVVVNRLVATGLARQALNPAHRKSPLIQMSDEGRARLDRLEHSLERELQAKIGTLDDAELSLAIECLRRTRELIYGTKDPAPRAKALETEPHKGTRTRKTSGAERKHSTTLDEPGSDESEAELPVNLL
jgi:DNA-binding MarR family transcriptional regulator